MENRDYKNYGGRFTKYRDFLTSKFITLFVIAARFALTTKNFTLNFEGWESTDSFNRREDSLELCKRSFNKTGIEFEKIKSEHKELFILLEKSALEFLEVSLDDYTLDSFSIDANNKKINVTAKHKTKADKRVTENISVEADFDAAIVNNPILVTAYLGFVWGFGKASDEFLAMLEPAE